MIVAPKSTDGGTSGGNNVKHPPASQMVNSAIRDLNERGGSSLRAIKKYIEAQYLIDVKRSMPYIKAHIKKSLENGSILKTTGHGFNGSFKLSKQEREAARSKEKPKAKPKETKAKKDPAQKPKLSAKASTSSKGKSEKPKKESKEKSENVKAKKSKKDENDNVKKAKTKRKSGRVEQSRKSKGEPKRPRQRIKLAMLNGTIIKRASLGLNKVKSNKIRIAKEA